MSNVSQKTKNTGKKTPRSSHLTAKVLVIGVVLAVVAILAVLFLFRNTSIYSVDVEDAKSDMQALLDKINPPSSTLLYSGTIDNGCDSRGSVGLAKRINCVLYGYEFHKTQGDVSEGMHAIDSSLTANGWYRKDVASGHTAEQVLNGEVSSSIYYLPAGDDSKRISVSLELDNGDGKRRDSRIENLQGQGKIGELKKEDRVYGIYLQQTYWYCAEQNLFIKSCFPPSGLKR